MSQVMHIFRKDVRRLWMEIALSLAVLVAYAVLDIRFNVFPPADPNFEFTPLHRQLSILMGVLDVLVPVSWWFIIARLVHAESLVGDRQFWITRPYEWKKLLGAKVLFLAVFVSLPFAVMQSSLLAAAGFTPYRYVPGLLFNLLLATGILYVPLMALAAVTKNFVHMTVTLIAIALIVAGVAAALESVDTTSVSTPYADRYSIPLVLLVGGFVIALQYARRRAWLARGILLTIPAGICIAGLSVSSQRAVDAAYPEPAHATDVPMRLIYTPEAEGSLEVHGGEPKDKVQLQIRAEAEGLTGSQAVKVDNFRVLLDGPQGKHWESGWEAVYNQQLLPGSYTLTYSLPMKRSKYEELRGVPLTMRLELAATVLRGGQATKLVLPDHEFSVPALGMCKVGRNRDGPPAEPRCRTAMHGPDYVRISATAPMMDCPGLGETGHASAWVGSLDNDPADFAFSPIFVTTPRFHSDEGDLSSLCANAMLSITRYERVRRVREHVEASGVRLPEETKMELRVSRP